MLMLMLRLSSLAHKLVMLMFMLMLASQVRKGLYGAKARQAAIPASAEAAGGRG